MPQSTRRAVRRTRQAVALIGLLFCGVTVLSAHHTSSAAPSSVVAGDLTSADMGEDTTGWD
ncbi:hypothetical protein ACIRJR_05290 [Streptomyces sp. NPDC102402]|uniref:hypothetical protein n=1 Tax=Streptomyces sp. NPDC102402 TaxID=3366169 RepID=UPI0038284C85